MMTKLLLLRRFLFLQRSKFTCIWESSGLHSCNGVLANETENLTAELMQEVELTVEGSRSSIVNPLRNRSAAHRSKFTCIRESSGLNSCNGVLVSKAEILTAGCKRKQSALIPSGPSVFLFSGSSLICSRWQCMEC